ncbi:hypothetical protein Moror_10537 [Moniliophthora roreri MCA 2997]|uniref:Uncharacterized protein n=1 Tax=Moniliophthora roreri (strain MCA 2997) TaxID=1381753 RepID=V2XG61_MONRO|nr:hypothetical protein Moror_10537 [Moniliophthora roreri MCA 2997]
MAGIALDKAEFVGLWVESILYGMNTILFAICIWVLVYYKKRSSGLNIPLLATAIFLYIFCTIRIGIDLGRGILAFFTFRNNPEGPLGFYEDISHWTRVLREALYVTNSLVADTLVIYRLYVVWGYNWKITVGPIILLLASSISGYIAVWEITRVASGGSIFAKQVADGATALFALSMGTNVIVTSLIAGRIWYIGHRASKHLGRQHGVKYSRALVVIVESGALYSVSLFILLILFAMGNDAQIILFNSASQIVGIAPTLIIVRVGLGLSAQDNLATVATSQLRNPAAADSGSARNPEAVRSNTIPMQIHRVIEMRTDDDFDLHTRSKDAGSDYKTGPPDDSV